MGCLSNNEGKNKDPRGGLEVKRSRMWGFPHSNEPEKLNEEELWVGVTPNGRRPRIWAPMKGALRPGKPRAERLIKISTAVKPEPQTGFVTNIRVWGERYLGKGP
ncbi:MAG: hypothetical protein DJ555_06235 [Desulfurococcaceae archaeon]|nr:MAG: hypothetical protein DJ555_06235 [Desulfurococcaceae archaeon]